MSLKSRKTDYSEVLVYLGTVIYKLQRFAVKGGMFVASEPFFIHIGKNAAEAVADKHFKWAVFKLCKSFVSVAEYPIDRTALFIKYHFNVRKGYGDIVKAPVMIVICFNVGRIVIIGKEFDYHFLLLLEFGYDLFFSCRGIIEYLAVAEGYLLVDAVNRHSRNKTASVKPDKSVTEYLFKLRKGHSCFEYTPVRRVDKSVLLFHCHIKYTAQRQRVMLSVRYK